MITMSVNKSYKSSWFICASLLDIFVSLCSLKSAKQTREVFGVQMCSCSRASVKQCTQVYCNPRYSCCVPVSNPTSSILFARNLTVLKMIKGINVSNLLLFAFHLLLPYICNVSSSTCQEFGVLFQAIIGLQKIQSAALHVNNSLVGGVPPHSRCYQVPEVPAIFLSCIVFMETWECIKKYVFFFFRKSNFS